MYFPHPVLPSPPRQLHSAEALVANTLPRNGRRSPSPHALHELRLLGTILHSNWPHSKEQTKKYL